MHLAHPLGHQHLDRVPESLFFGVPEDERGGRVPQKDQALARFSDNDAVVQRVEERAEAELMRKKRLKRRLRGHMSPSRWSLKANIGQRGVFLEGRVRCLLSGHSAILPA